MFGDPGHSREKAGKSAAGLHMAAGFDLIDGIAGSLKLILMSACAVGTDGIETSGVESGPLGVGFVRPFFGV